MSSRLSLATVLLLAVLGSAQADSGPTDLWSLYLREHAVGLCGRALSEEQETELARISHAGRCIGALSESKLLCNNDLASFGGSPRCRRSVAQTYLVLHPLRAVGWRRVSTAGRSPPMRARFCSGRPTASSAWLGALQAASWMRAGRT